MIRQTPALVSLPSVVTLSSHSSLLDMSNFIVWVINDCLPIRHQFIRTRTFSNGSLIGILRLQSLAPTIRTQSASKLPAQHKLLRWKWSSRGSVISPGLESSDDCGRLHGKDVSARSRGDDLLVSGWVAINVRGKSSGDLLICMTGS